MIKTKDVTEEQYFRCYSKIAIEKAAGVAMVVSGLAEIYFEEAVIDSLREIFKEGLNVDVARKYERTNKEENKGTEFHIYFWPDIIGDDCITLEFDLEEVILDFLDESDFDDKEISSVEDSISLAVKYRDGFLRLAKLIDTRLGNQGD